MGGTVGAAKAGAIPERTDAPESFPCDGEIAAGQARARGAVRHGGGSAVAFLPGAGLAGGMFAAARDALTSRTARSYLQPKIAAYATIERLGLDSAARRLELEVRLLGETEPLAVTVEGYRLGGTAEARTVEITAVTASRPWVAAALRTHVQGRTFPVPAWLAALL